MLTETAIAKMLQSGKIGLPPVDLTPLKGLQGKQALQSDQLVEVSWQGQRYKFIAEIKRYSSDKTIRAAIDSVQKAAREFNANPLVIVPWLSDEQLAYLEKSGVSGIDLSGNGILIVPGKLLIQRSGKSNAFPESRLVRNVYDGNTSLVARMLLIKPIFYSVTELVREINARSAFITQSTVSKALRQLEEDVVISRNGGNIKLIQSEKLLNRLIANFKPPSTDMAITCKINADPEEVPRLLFSAAKKCQGKLITTGKSTVFQYAVMAREPLMEYYTDLDPTILLDNLRTKVQTENLFPNARVVQTNDRTVYFDMKVIDGAPISSPIQTCLELMAGDKRDVQVADQIRLSLLTQVDKLSKDES